MAKSARASGIKKNKAALKKRVFGPVETARNDRLSAKLLELAKQPKPAREEMDIEQANDAKLSEKQAAGDNQPTAGDADADMDVDGEGGKSRLSNREIKRRREERAARVEKKRKPRNRTTFEAHPKKRKGGRR